jgi:hypothetical protein
MVPFVRAERNKSDEIGDVAGFALLLLSWDETPD